MNLNKKIEKAVKVLSKWGIPIFLIWLVLITLGVAYSSIEFKLFEQTQEHKFGTIISYDVSNDDKVLIELKNRALIFSPKTYIAVYDTDNKFISGFSYISKEYVTPVFNENSNIELHLARSKKIIITDLNGNALKEIQAGKEKPKQLNSSSSVNGTYYTLKHTGLLLLKDEKVIYKSGKVPSLTELILIAVLIIVLIFLYKKAFKKRKIEMKEKSLEQGQKGRMIL